ncbi:protein-glutamate methylesterase/protein-glutamine glutaminase [Thermodesulfatator autotrophicus]|uniref:Protein-glutamate methylesterase/protein-glutamine glutaminase n=1 Tax=Thermodesulfatator autotrophicus TaxID=1795632 RepID=A0A177E8N3_9BACT|nr:chemotaxis response regulator protein-glutamate methylesterase [Thermodesulfatator autotrophicus]OAG28317.1 chemotaxis response regulator protein-glutamate methylesterase [Thermodesulfatator autotrophicus]
MKRIRVLVVDDSPLVRRLISEALKADPEIELVGTASNGKEAIDKVRLLRPEVITLDIEMPVMDGLTALEKLKRLYPKVQVIMFSTLTEKGAKETIKALSLGAFDFVTKPSSRSLSESIKRIKEELIPKIKSAVPQITTPVRPVPQKPAITKPAVKPVQRRPLITGRREVVAIGVSTGGPKALSDIIPKLPAGFPVPILIVQHMPPLFTAQLASRLDQLSALKVVEAQAGMPLGPGKVFIAPGDQHMEVAKRGVAKVIHLHKGPPENSCRPAVDVLFRSVAKVYGGRSVAMVLTGMGQDGLAGAMILKEAGALIVAQDEATSTVYGMPRAVVEAGLADYVLPLQEIPLFLQKIFLQRKVA